MWINKVKNLFILVLKEEWQLVPIFILQIMVETIVPMTTVLYINEIIKNLCLYKIKNAVLNILLLNLVGFLFAFFSEILVYWKKRLLRNFNIKIKEKVIDKINDIEYGKYETNKYREAYSFALKCIQSDFLSTVMNSIGSIISNLITFLTLSSIVAYTVWWFWILILFSAVVKVSCELYCIKHNYEIQKDKNNIEIKMLYSRDRLTWKLFAKEVRLFKMFDYVSNKAAFFIDKLSKLQEYQANRNIQTLWWVHLFNGLQTITVYIFVSHMYFTNQIDVANFTTIAISFLLIIQMISNSIEATLAIKENYLYVNNLVEFISESDINEMKKEEINGFSTIVCSNVCYPFQKHM